MRTKNFDSIIIHLLEVMANMGILVQIKIGNAPAYVSSEMKQFFVYYSIKHITVVPHNATGKQLYKDLISF